MHFKNLTGFIQQFVNGAALKVADRKEFWGAVQSERLLQAERRNRKKKVIGSKEVSGYIKVTFL